MPTIDSILTPRLRLRALTHADAPFLVALLNDPDFLRHIGDRGVRDETDACRYLDAGPLASYERHGHGLLLMETRDGGLPLGLCGLLKRDGLADVDLGYALLPAHRGSGYVDEAAQAVLTHAWSVLGLKRIVAVVAPGNPASENVLRRLGFAYEAPVMLNPEEAPLRLFACVAPA